MTTSFKRALLLLDLIIMVIDFHKKRIIVQVIHNLCNYFFAGLDPALK